LFDFGEPSRRQLYSRIGCQISGKRYVIFTSELLFGRPTVPHFAKPALSLWDQESVASPAWRAVRLGIALCYTRFDSNTHGRGPAEMLVNPEGWGGNFINSRTRAFHDVHNNVTLPFFGEFKAFQRRVHGFILSFGD